MQVIRRKLTAISYGAKGQDPGRLFKAYDRDGSGQLDFTEFKAAIRKGGHMTVAMISDDDLKRMFDSLDKDRSGDVGIEELTGFVWGEDPGSPADTPRQRRKKAEERPSAARAKKKTKSKPEPEPESKRKAQPKRSDAPRRTPPRYEVTSPGKVNKVSKQRTRTPERRGSAGRSRPGSRGRGG